MTEEHFEARRFWSLPVNPELGPERPEAGPAQRTLELLRDAVRLRLRSDVLWVLPFWWAGLFLHCRDGQPAHAARA